MKKLNGMKNFSSLENKKLNDLSKITGGLRPVYGVKSTDEEIIKDSANINRNRRLIGLQSFKVRRKITKEFLKNNSSKK